MVGVFVFIPRSYLIHASSSYPVGDNLTALPASDDPVPEKSTPPWVQARRDRVLAEKQFNGLAVFLVDTHEEAEQLATAE